jgi:hypothetical protein
LKRLDRPGSFIFLDTELGICRKVYRGPFAEERAFDERTALEVCRRVGLLAPRALRSGHGKAPWLEMTLERGLAWEGHVAEAPREYVTAVGDYLRCLHGLFRPDSPGFGWLPSRQDIFSGASEFLIFLVRDQIASLPAAIGSGMTRLISAACHDSPLVPLHRDVKPEHALGTDLADTFSERKLMRLNSLEGMCLLDWEYASRGPAFYDWAMLTWRACCDLPLGAHCSVSDSAVAEDALVSAVIEVSGLPQQQLAVGIARAALVWAQHRGSAEFAAAVRCCTAALDGASPQAILEISGLGARPCS